MRKFNYVKNFDKKHFYLFLLVLFGFITIFFSTSYGLFKKSDHLTDIDFVAGELNYTITNSSLTNNSITVASGSERQLTLTLKSTNSVSSKYELYYLIDDKKVANDSVIVGYTSGSTAVKGTISANSSKSITIKIKNVSDKSVKITFGCEGGLSNNTLTLSKGLSLDKLITDGDIEMYYTYVGTGTAPSKFPNKGDGYYIKSISCNGMDAQWNNFTWSLAFSNVTGSKIICSAKIDTPYLSDYIMAIADDDDSESSIRKYTHNATGNQNFSATEYRYWGANPDNYVQFNGETWRIIGVFDVDNGSGTIQKRVKIVRNESIGEYSWDSSASTIDSGYGINEWSKADLKTLLNSGPYYNRTTGTCYNGKSNATTSCSFTSTGLTSASRAMIGNAKWYLGTNNSSYANVEHVYEAERSSTVTCTSCSDGVTRTTVWAGSVGLMYPSDYMYSHSNPSYTLLDSWLDDSYTEHLLNPFYSTSYFHYNYVRTSNNTLTNTSNYKALAVRPTVYLLPTVRLTGGTGKSNDMYTISQ